MAGARPNARSDRGLATACRGELRVNVLRPTQRAQRQSGRWRWILTVLVSRRSALRDRHGPRLQRDQEGRRGPQDIRRRGAAAATRAAAATAEGHAEGPAAAGDSAAAGADGSAAAADRRPSRRRLRRRFRRSRPPPPPPAPPPPPRKVQSAQSAKGDLRTLFSADDYPASAQSAGAEGTAQATLTIGPDGRVVGCNIIRSTRQQRARFRDLQHPSPPREVHAGARQQRQRDDGHHYDAADRVAAGRLIRLRFSTQDFQKESTAMQAAPAAAGSNPYGLIPALQQGGIIAISVFIDPRDHVAWLVLHPLHQADAAAEDHQPGPQGPRELLELAEPARSFDQARGEERLSRDRRRRAASRRTSTAS